MTENLLDETLQILPAYRGKFKHSRMAVADLARYTKPEGCPGGSVRDLYTIARWLLRWALAREPEYEIVNAALCLARSHFAQMPRYWESPARTKGLVDDMVRYAAAKALAIAFSGSESIRDPSSNVDSAVSAEKRHREQEEIAAHNQRQWEQRRALLTGAKPDGEPARPKPRLLTIGQEKERLEQEAAARKQQNASRVRQVMGW